MKQLLWTIVIVMPFFVSAQGIQFEYGLTWEQVRQKAIKENKFIFVDCTASWCKPCKQMDREIFTLSDVGDYMNDHFISIHVQMDTSKNDDEQTKSWYKDASMLQHQHSVKVFPSYLFFLPEGKLVHRYMYSLTNSDFLKTAADALEPNRQYCVLLQQYLLGKKDYSRMIYLSVYSKNMKEDSIANIIARDYLSNYLNVQGQKVILQKRNFQFIELFLSQLTSKDRFFTFIYRNPDKIDSIMNQRGKGKFYVQRIITKEEIDSKIWKDKSPVIKTPDWGKLHSNIKKKYNQWYADKTVLDAQYGWYLRKNDSAKVIKYRVKQIEKYGLDTTGLGWAFINNFAWDYVFGYCKSKDTLNIAAGWMEQILIKHPEDVTSLDTYANLLYKAGRKEEAIKYEEKAAGLETAISKNEKRDPNPNYAETLNKMKKDIPTW